MTVITSVLAIMLVRQDATPPGPAKCPPTDNRCKAEQFVQRAAAAGSARHRALHLHAAHRSYLALFDQTGEVRDLCAARRTFDQSLAIQDQPDSQRASFEALRNDLTSREHTHGVRCGSSAKRPKARSSVMQAPRSSDPGTFQTTATPGSSPVGGASEPPGDPPLIESTTRPIEPTQDIALLPVTPRPRAEPLPPPAAPTAIDAHPGRPLVIAGSVTLGAGLVLTGLAGYMGNRLIQTQRDAQTLATMVEGFATTDQLAQDEALGRDYRRMGPQTLALALAAGTTVVAAAVLLGVGGRRMARATHRAAFLPIPGGLAFHARF